MTKQNIPSICDFHGKPIESEEQYTVQISKKSSEKGSFITTDNKGDMCHSCFLEMCKNGYKPKWVKKSKNPDTGKWDTKPMEI